MQQTTPSNGDPARDPELLHAPKSAQGLHRCGGNALRFGRNRIASTHLVKVTEYIHVRSSWYECSEADTIFQECRGFLRLHHRAVSASVILGKDPRIRMIRPAFRSLRWDHKKDATPWSVRIAFGSERATNGLGSWYACPSVAGVAFPRLSYSTRTV